MDLFLSVLAIILLLVGIAGAILPIIPGPLMSFLGLVSLFISSHEPLTNKFMFIWAALAIGITLIDYIVPVLGTKKMGGSKKGVYGSTIGLIFGLLFLGPLGILIGAFGGAVIGELIDGKEFNSALKAGFGSFAGFVAGTLLKLVYSIWAAYYIVINLYFFK
ncbi:MAG: DUF456 domain-containing protein [Bacteroidota bacterium]